MAILNTGRDWREEVRDPEARLVFEALADRRWDFRTIDGLAEATRLPATRVREILLEYRPFVRQSPVLDRRGRELYTLSSRASTLREFISSARAFISKSTSTE